LYLPPLKRICTRFPIIPPRVSDPSRGVPPPFPFTPPVSGKSFPGLPLHGQLLMARGPFSALFLFRYVWCFCTPSFNLSIDTLLLPFSTKKYSRFFRFSCLVSRPFSLLHSPFPFSWAFSPFLVVFFSHRDDCPSSVFSSFSRSCLHGLFLVFLNSAIFSPLVNTLPCRGPPTPKKAS